MFSVCSTSATSELHEAMAAPFRTPCQVRIHSLNARPDLNGRRGRADSYDQQTTRFRVTMDSGEQVALKANNLIPDEPPPPPPPVGGGGMPALEPRFAGICVAAALVFLLEASPLVAVALGGVVYLLMTASRQHGGVRQALGTFAFTLSDGFGRITGM